MGDVSPAPSEAFSTIDPHATYDTPAEFMAAHRLQKFSDSVTKMGCLTMHDVIEVTADDLTSIGMPPLQQRRFLAAAKTIPPPPMVMRLHGVDGVAAVIDRVDELVLNNQLEADANSNTVKNATQQVVQVVDDVYSKAVDPWQWLADFRLEAYKVNFQGLGVRDIVDFTEVLDQDLHTMDMPMVQFRRFREAAALIPPAAGGSYRLDLYAAEAADKAVDDAMRVKTWLKCLRLLHLEPKLLSIGVMQLRDFRELREEDLVAMGMPLLQRRRFLMSAAVAVPLLPPSAEAALAQLQNASATAQSVPGWLQATHLEKWTMAFDALGVLDIVDFKEVVRSDLEEMELPLLQMRRFLAAVAILPAPPELPGRRWEKPARWLESLRLKRFEAALVKLGVERVVDFGELMTMDLVAVGMSPLQRRRFQAAVETDAQPTLEGEVLLPTRAVTEADQRVAAERSAVVVGSTGAMRSEDVLRLTPARWLSLIRCESFTEKFEELGVETSVDFAEVTEDDLQTMGVPLLHKRRFTQAAVQVEEISLYHQAHASEQVVAVLDATEAKAVSAAAERGEDEAAAETVAAVASTTPTMRWLAALRLTAFLKPLAELGVEDLMDFAEVLTEDLVSIGMKPLQRRRFQQAALELRT